MHRFFRPLALFVLAVLALTISAPADIGVDVSPMKLELSMTPGTSYTVPLTIHNSSTEAVHMVATMLDFGLAQNGNYQFGQAGSRANSLMKYASINPRQFDLPANTTQQVRLSIALPNERLKGEYAGVVMFQTRPTRTARAVAFAVRLAAKVYMTIQNTVKVDGAISKMSVADGPLGGQVYRVLFRNLGNEHVYLNGEVDVRKGGVTVARLPMDKEILVERGGERLIEVNGSALPPGKYEVIAMIDYGGKTQTGGEILYDKK